MTGICVMSFKALRIRFYGEKRVQHGIAQIFFVHTQMFGYLVFSFSEDIRTTCARKFHPSCKRYTSFKSLSAFICAETGLKAKKGNHNISSSSYPIVLVLPPLDSASGGIIREFWSLIQLGCAFGLLRKILLNITEYVITSLLLHESE